MFQATQAITAMGKDRTDGEAQLACSVEWRHGRLPQLELAGNS